MSGRYFDDFQIGQNLPHAGARTLGSGERALYIALTGAPQPLHCAQTLAAALGFDRMPQDPLLVFHVVFGLTVADISRRAIANLGYADARFHAPVFDGDTLNVSSSVIGLKENSNKQSGIVYVHSRTFNQHQLCVLEWKRWVLLPKRSSDSVCAPASVPALPEQVTPEHMSSAQTRALPTDFAEALNAFTGSAKRARDYQPGAVIVHGGGNTIGESEHMLATRLYQNSARVHFDEAFMRTQNAGRRLVYGGHIMSLVRAQAYQDLENGFYLAAMHGGTHAHPSFAGDTIYAATVVIGSSTLKPGLSALRLCSFGLKAEPDAELLAQLPAMITAQKLPESVALRWDYSVLMPE